jgi:hypothetical protein
VTEAWLIWQDYHEALADVTDENRQGFVVVGDRIEAIAKARELYPYDNLLEQNIVGPFNCVVKE